MEEGWKSGVDPDRSQTVRASSRMMFWGGGLFKAKAVNEVDTGGGEARGGGGSEKGPSNNSTLY
jgi:hypothetical protein